MSFCSFTNDTGQGIRSISYVDGKNKKTKVYDYKDVLPAGKKAWAYAKEFASGTIEKIEGSKPFQYTALAFEALLFLNAINNSYAYDLKVTNKIKGTNQPVKYGKVYLMRGGSKVDSLITDANGYCVFRNVPTPVEEQKEYEFRVSNAFPNPAEGSASVIVEVPSSNNKNNSVKCSVFDIKGSKIKDFAQQNGPGIYRVDWDGTNNSNEKVASGIYLLTTETAAGNATVKFAYMKGAPSLSSGMSFSNNNADNEKSGKWAATLSKSSGVPAVYQLKFDNDSNTQPKIKSWTTNSFVFATNKDTTVYSEKLPINVSGIVMNAYTMFPVANAKVKIKYENAGKTDSTFTNSSGSYLISFDPADAATSNFTVTASKSGFYSCKKWPKTTANQLIDTLYTFEQFTDPMNTASSDPRKDLLEYIKYMHPTVDILDNSYTKIQHWLPKDLPLKAFIDTTEGIENQWSEPRFNPGQAGMKTTRDAIAKTNSRFEKNKFTEVSNIQDSKIRIFYGKYGSRSSDKKELNPSFGSLYPVSGWVDLKTDSTGVVRFNERIAMHELGHIWWCSGTHSPFASHLISDYLGVNDFSDFEARAITILYNLPNTVTSSDPFVVAKYVLYKE